MERTHGPLRETDGLFAGMHRLSLLIAVTYQKKKNREPVSRFAFRRLKNRLFINMTAYYARACRCRTPTLFSSLLFPSLLLPCWHGQRFVTRFISRWHDTRSRFKGNQFSSPPSSRGRLTLSLRRFGPP